MRKLMIIALSAAALSVITPTMAAAQGFGDAGCGLGSMLFGNRNDFVQIFAATTNGTFGNQTFAISTGTSNCSGLSSGATAAADFIEQNRASVATDAARGDGPSIESISHLAGCADPNAVGMALQAHYGFIFPNAGVSDTDVSGTILEILTNESELMCEHLG